MQNLKRSRLVPFLSGWGHWKGVWGVGGPSGGPGQLYLYVLRIQISSTGAAGVCAGFNIFGASSGMSIATCVWVAGFATLLEKKSRRMELALYCLSRAAESYCRCVCGVCHVLCVCELL